MSVVCVKVASIRPKYQNLKEWIEDLNNVYIGRRGVVFVDGVRFPPKDSIFANPFKIGKDGDRKEVLQKYKIYIEDKLKSGKITKENLRELKGKILGCWCYPLPCHGNILLEIIEKYV